jgi:hypothetical protein
MRSGTRASVRRHAWPVAGTGPRLGLAATMVLHAMLLLLAAGTPSLHDPDRRTPGRAAATPQVVLLLRLPPPREAARPPPAPPAPSPPPALRAPPRPAPEDVATAAPDAARPPASMAAPPAPTAAQWAFAARYTLKNSKAYRHTWGQQVRSMMGTAVEGPDQGMVRLRVEIAPDGSLVRLETLWSTSPVAERLARQAIAAMPRWPATPTGRPLVFERTLSFTPFASDDPPLYKDDCLPDPPVFSNPFAWNGTTAREPPPAAPVAAPDPQALQDCLRQLPPDSIEAESARDRRLMDQWSWSASQPRR